MLTRYPNLIDEATVGKILEPLRERYRRELGLTWEWKYAVDLDEWDNPRIWVRVYKDEATTGKDLFAIQQAVWATLDASGEIDGYLPMVQFLNVAGEDYDDEDD